MSATFDTCRLCMHRTPSGDVCDVKGCGKTCAGDLTVTASWSYYDDSDTIEHDACSLDHLGKLTLAAHRWLYDATNGFEDFYMPSIEVSLHGPAMAHAIGDMLLSDG